jgi:hypothetical protein
MSSYKKLQKILIVILCSVMLFGIIIIIFISPLAKYLIEKYDQKYLFRQITVDRVYLNPFTGYINLSNLKIYETKSDSILLSAESLSINFSILKLFSNTIEFTECNLNKPRLRIIQNETDFNFTDFLSLFSSKKDLLVTKEVWNFTIKNIMVIEGEINFHEPLAPINYSIKNLNISSKGKSWDSDTISIQLSFLAGTGTGSFDGNISINLKTLDYKYVANISEFDLNLLAQYLKELTNYGQLTSTLEASIKSNGNFLNAEDVNFSGKLQLSNLHFGKTSGEDYASFDKMVFAMKDISPKEHVYLFDSVVLIKPFLKYEIYDSLDNYETIFGKNSARIKSAINLDNKFNLIIEIGKYVKILAKNFFHSYYQVNHLAISSGAIKFNDYSLNEKFSIDLAPFSINADSIDKNHDIVRISMKSGIKPYGDIAIDLKVNPKDSGTFDMKYHFQRMPVSMFNPYLIAYTAFPLDRGTIEINGTWDVNEGIIESENHLVIIDPRVTKRIKYKNAKHLPLPFLMAFIRDRGNVLDFEIPITGNLKNPKFHLNDVVTDVIQNIFVKPATTNYRAEIKKIENEIEKSQSIKWEMRSSSLQESQIKYIEMMTDYLKAHPEDTILIQPEQYSIKEKEYILFYEAKKKYFISYNKTDPKSFNSEDSLDTSNMSTRDLLFKRYLNSQVNDSTLFTLQEQCSKIIDEATVNNCFKQLSKEREDAFKYYFTKKNVQLQVIFLPAKNTIPYNGFSFFKIIYTGLYPESLAKAYNKMWELNNENPRDKFKSERKINSNTSNENKTLIEN